MSKIRYHIAGLFMLVWVCGLQAQQAEQNVEQLREQREKFLAEIFYTEQLLESTKNTRTDQLQKMRLLKGKINKRESLIGLMNREIAYLEKVISNRNGDIEELRQELDMLKKDYARMIQKAYQTKKAYDRAQYILAASDFNQAYKRIRYMQQYNKFRREQAEEIRQKQDILQQQITELRADQEKKRDLLDSQKNEVARLNNERRQKDIVLQDLSRSERQLRSQLNEKKKAMQRIEEEIASIIEENTGSGSGMALTPEMKIISTEFGNNKGRLPWPVERGVIVSKFGKHKHEVLSRVDVDNKGVDIATGQSATVRSVFNGKISNVISIKGANLTVIIQHGEYFTVYQNLVSLSVKKGDLVQTKQVIGKVYSDNSSNNSEMHFELWKGNKIQNPELWLAK